MMREDDQDQRKIYLFDVQARDGSWPAVNTLKERET